MQGGCGTYLYVFIWGIGLIFTLGGFIVQPRDQAPLFYTIGVIGLIVAAVLTYFKIIVPKREAEKAGHENSHLMEKIKEKSPGFLIWIAIIAICIIIVLIVTTDVGTWIIYIVGGAAIIYAILQFAFGSRR